MRNLFKRRKIPKVWVIIEWRGASGSSGKQPFEIEFKTDEGMWSFVQNLVEYVRKYGGKK